MLCRYAVAKFKRKEMVLAYTVDAMFQMGDMLAESEQIMELFESRNADGFKRFCEAVSIMARCGARARESEGFPRPYIPEASELMENMLPIELVELKREAINAVLLGYGREIVNREEEVDIELANIEKKRNPPEHPS